MTHDNQSWNPCAIVIYCPWLMIVLDVALHPKIGKTGEQEDKHEGKQNKIEHHPLYTSKL
jgi:hypothetical protein